MFTGENVILHPLNITKRALEPDNENGASLVEPITTPMEPVAQG